MMALSAKEIRELAKLVRASARRAGTRIAVDLPLLTFVRKRELTQPTWDQIDFDAAHPPPPRAGPHHA